MATELDANSHAGGLRRWRLREDQLSIGVTLEAKHADAEGIMRQGFDASSSTDRSSDIPLFYFGMKHWEDLVAAFEQGSSSDSSSTL